jgi:hypothetical protein
MLPLYMMIAAAVLIAGGFALAILLSERRAARKP